MAEAAAKKKTLLEEFMAGCKKGFYIGAENIMPAMVLAYSLILFLNITGLMDIIANAVAPVMALFGLPGGAIVALISAFFAKAAGAATAASLYAEGVIEGGTVHNSAPAYAKMIVDMRFTDPAMLEAMKAKFREINDKVYVDGVTCKMTSVSLMQPMVELESSKELFELVKKVYEEEGFGSPKAITVGGGSDSAYTTMVGVPTVCAMGVKGGRNHTVDEFANVESLFKRAKLMCAVMLAL